MSFHDHFSEISAGYARFRPRYPERLFEFLAESCDRRQTAWDCATGSGQAAVPLARYFERVVASDASLSQIQAARRAPRVSYLGARAEAPPFRDRSLDLITVAQAAHWLDLDPFYRSVVRILKEGGIVAFWAHGLFETAGPLNSVTSRFYRETVAEYWPPQRKHIDNRLRDLPFPFPEIEAPDLTLELSWTLPQLIGYLGTWSATRRYYRTTGRDPLELIRTELGKYWGPQPERQFRWPLHFRIGKLRETRRFFP